MTMQIRLLSIVSLLWLFVTACTTTSPPTPTPTITFTPEPTLTPTATFTPAPTTPPIIIPNTEAQNPADQAYLRVVNAAPNSTKLDVYIEMLAIGTNLAFKQFTGQVGIEAGEYIIRITQTGGQPLRSALLEQNITIRGGDQLILLVTEVETELTIATVPEETAPLAHDEQRVSFIHAVPRGADFVVEEDSDVITPQLTFGQTSPGIIIEARNPNFVLTSGEQTLQQIYAELEARHNHTFILVGNSLAPETLEIINFNTQAAGISRVRAINASVDIGEVTFLLGGIRLDEGLNYTEASERLELNSGSYQIEVYPNEADRSIVEPLITGRVNATADQDVTLILIGEPERLRVISHLEDSTPVLVGDSRIYFMNSLPNVPEIILQTNELELPLNYGEISQAYDVGSGLYSFSWSTRDTVDESGETLEGTEYELRSGTRYLYIFAGRTTNLPLIYEDFIGSLDPDNPDVPIMETEEVDFSEE